MKERYFVIIWSHDGTRYALNGTNRRDLFKRIRSNFPGSRPFCHEVSQRIYQMCGDKGVSTQEFWDSLDLELEEQRREEVWKESHPSSAFMENLPVIGGWLKNSGLSRNYVIEAIVTVIGLIIAISVVINFMHSYGVLD